MIDLAKASLHDIARELRSRKATCPQCGGWGRVDRRSSSTLVSLSEQACPRCFGCGLVEDTALTRIADELEKIH